MAIPSEDPSFTASIPLALVTEQEGIQLSKAFEGSVSALRPSSSRTWVEGVVQALRDTGVVEQTKTKAWLDFQSKNFSKLLHGAHTRKASKRAVGLSLGMACVLALSPVPGQMTEVKSRRPLCPEDPFEDSCED